MRFLRIFKKAQKIKSKKLTFKVYLAFNLQFLKIEKFNNFDDFQKSKNIIYSTYMVFFIVFLAKIRVLARISCQN
jgi:hypothetical protein